MNKISKTKVLAITGVIGLGALAIGAGTLAYFNDTDTATNTFTVGKVDIALNETDNEGNPFKQDQKLFPGSSKVNAIAKNATVTVKEGSEDSWVWVELLIPSELYESKTETNETNNALHYNQFLNYLQGYTADSSNPNAQTAAQYYNNSDHQWTVMKYIDQVTVGNTTYARLRTTHKDKVTAGNTTSPAVNQFYMDNDVYTTESNGKTVYMIPATGASSDPATNFVEYSGTWEVIVNAYAMQATGFSTVDDAVAAYVAHE